MMNAPTSTSIGQNPLTETIYFRKYSVNEGFFVENTRLRECAAGAVLGDSGQFCCILGYDNLFPYMRPLTRGI